MTRSDAEMNVLPFVTLFGSDLTNQCIGLFIQVCLTHGFLCIVPCAPLTMIPVGPRERRGMMMEFRFVLNYFFVVVYASQMYWNKCYLLTYLVENQVSKFLQVKNGRLLERELISKPLGDRVNI